MLGNLIQDGRRLSEQGPIVVRLHCFVARSCENPLWFTSPTSQSASSIGLASTFWVGDVSLICAWRRRKAKAPPPLSSSTSAAAEVSVSVTGLDVSNEKVLTKDSTLFDLLLALEDSSVASVPSDAPEATRISELRRLRTRSLVVVFGGRRRQLHQKVTNFCDELRSFLNLETIARGRFAEVLTLRPIWELSGARREETTLASMRR
jgi:hypothetical protein